MSAPIRIQRRYQYFEHRSGHAHAGPKGIGYRCCKVIQRADGYGYSQQLNPKAAELRSARYPSPPSTAGSLAENPDDIFLALRRYCAVQRTVRRTRDQVRRVRFFFHKKPAEAGSCASTQTVNPG